MFCCAVSNNGATSFQCSKSEGISKTVIAILACNISSSFPFRSSCSLLTSSPRADEPTRHPLPSLGAIHCIKAFHLPHIPLSTSSSSVSSPLRALTFAPSQSVKSHPLHSVFLSTSYLR